MKRQSGKLLLINKGVLWFSIFSLAEVLWFSISSLIVGKGELNFLPFEVN